MNGSHVHDEIRLLYRLASRQRHRLKKTRRERDGALLEQVAWQCREAQLRAQSAGLPSVADDLRRCEDRLSALAEEIMAASVRERREGALLALVRRRAALKLREACQGCYR